MGTRLRRSNMKKLLTILILSAVVFGGCASASSPTNRQPTAEKTRAEHVLEENGYENINITGAAILGCSEDDSIFTSKHFTAKNSAGNNVEGTVCCGLLLKGCTVRF